MSGLEPLLIASIISTAAGTALSAAGTIASGKAMAQQARNEANVRRWQAEQMEVQGKEEFAMSQRQADQLRREKKLALSRLQATSAASGFTANDPTTLDLAGDIEQYGTFREQMALYGGETKKRDLQYGAAGSRYSAMMSDQLASDYKTNSYLNAAGTIASGAGSIFAKYAPTKAPSQLKSVYHGWGYVPTYG